MIRLLAFLATMLLTLYIMIMYEVPWMFKLLIIEAGLLIISYGTALYIRSRLHIRFMPEQIVVQKGEEAVIEIQAENCAVFIAAVFKACIRAANDFTKSAEKYHVCSAVDSKSVTAIQLKVEAEYCGTLTLHTAYIHIYDCFRLASLKKKLPASMTIHVMPRMLPADVEVVSNFRYFTGESDQYSDTQSGDDPSEIFEIRSYRPGDKIQKIHWKLTAKSEDVMIKEYSDPIGYAIVIALDMRSAGGNDKNMRLFDAMIECIISISGRLIEENYYHYIAWMDENGQIVRYKISGADAVYEVMPFILKARFYKLSEGIEDCYNNEFGRNSYHSIVTVDAALAIHLNGSIAGHIDLNDIEKSLAKLGLEI